MSKALLRIAATLILALVLLGTVAYLGEDMDGIVISGLIGVTLAARGAWALVADVVKVVVGV